MTGVSSAERVEARVLDALAERREAIVDLARTLIGFDTTARYPGDPPRDEAALQAHLADRLRRAGADVELWEADPSELDDRQLPAGLEFDGRPQLVARFPGRGTGHSLLFGGHIDAVSVEPRERWSSDPLRAEVRDGVLYGRGACDMKGGVAAMVVAAETLAELGIELGGELIVSTITDEESSGAGGLAAVAHGVRADAGLVPEPTGFAAWVACRGILNPTITVPGRSGHADMPQPDWRDGGAVNAVDKAMTVLAAIRDLQDAWKHHPEYDHPLLAPGLLVPTLVSAGDWMVTIPSACRITLDVTYLHAQADDDGHGTRVMREIEEHVIEAASRDDWLAEHPPTFQWGADLPPAELRPDHPIVACALGAAATVGRPGAAAGMNSWHDAATFTRAGTPTIDIGPSGFDSAHAVDERVPVNDLVACAQTYALCAMRFTASPERVET
ncbi:MAG TPA: M20/M25/M40 family metallo-hydrolase [Solirubrobacteraceae bacterium]|nr:M20/M25/M40 family metallo-hydrolase [Solirubrobacteraceae bacterium]